MLDARRFRHEVRPRSCLRSICKLSELERLPDHSIRDLTLQGEQHGGLFLCEAPSSASTSTSIHAASLLFKLTTSSPTPDQAFTRRFETPSESAGMRQASLVTTIGSARGLRIFTTRPHVSEEKGARSGRTTRTGPAISRMLVDRMEKIVTACAENTQTTRNSREAAPSANL